MSIVAWSVALRPERVNILPQSYVTTLVSAQQRRTTARANWLLCAMRLYPPYRPLPPCK